MATTNTKIRMCNKQVWTVQETIEDIKNQMQHGSTFHCIVHLKNDKKVALLSKHISSVEDLR